MHKSLERLKQKKENRKLTFWLKNYKIFTETLVKIL